METTPDTAVGLADELMVEMFLAEPLAPTLLGVPGYDDQLADPSEEFAAGLRERVTRLGERAATVSTVNSQDEVTRKVVAQQCRSVLDNLDARAVEYTISDLFVAPAAGLLTALPMIVVADADRAQPLEEGGRAVPRYLDGVVERHRAGLAAGRLPVATLVRNAVAHLDRYLGDPDHDPLAREQPVAAELPSFVDDRARVLAEVVRPAFARYRDTIAGEFLDRGRPDDRPGLGWLPDGDAMYAALSRVHTTTDRTPDDLHQAGLDLIAGLAEEYAALGQQVFGTAELTEIFHRLRTDPALRWHDADELLTAARTAITRAEAEAPKWFGRLPSQRCQVEPVPAAEAPGAPGAYYMLASLDGLRPGTYYANTYEATERYRQTSEATAFHEAVPGHHFQITIAMELANLPLLRRFADVTAYAEGWGLYCERLADEMGLYSGDLDRLGMLTLDSMRACRLVVDTGLHAKGWSRQQAIDYMTQNSPMPPVEIVAEVDRYIAAPGQALAYMVGRLEIQRLRAATEARLGERFDIRGFHDEVLGSGPLPLTVLAEVIDAWAA
jgi:uncharacterized protein (DUF885 family)